MSQKNRRGQANHLHEDHLISEIIEWIELRGSHAKAIEEIAFALDVHVSVVEQVMLGLMRDGIMVLVGAGILDYYESA